MSFNRFIATNDNRVIVTNAYLRTLVTEKRLYCLVNRFSEYFFIAA